MRVHLMPELVRNKWQNNSLLSLYTFPLNFPAAGPWDTTGKRFLSESWREKSFRQISLWMKHFACSWEEQGPFSSDSHKNWTLLPMLEAEIV